MAEQPPEPSAPASAEPPPPASDDSGALPPSDAPPPGPSPFVRFFQGLPPWVAVIGGLGTVALLLLAFGLVLRGLGDFLVILVIAAALAYVIDPAIDRFERAGWNRSVAIGTFLVTVIAFAGLTLLLIVPYVFNQITALTGDVDRYTARIADTAVWVQAELHNRLGIDVDLRVDHLLQTITQYVREVNPEALNPVKAAASSLLGSTGRALSALFRWSLFPVFAFFLLRDFDALKRGVFDLIPYRSRRLVLDHWVEIDQRMSSFVRGQLIVCGVLAVLYALGLLLFTNIDMALLIGILSGLLFIIPYLGTVLGIVLGSLLALLKFGISFEVVRVWLVFAAVQGLEGTVLTPKIVGDSVGLHPMIVMIALLVGGTLFGLIGVLLAVPFAAALLVLGRTGVSWYRQSHWFQDGKEGAPGLEDLP